MPVVAERWRALFEQHSNVLCELVDGARVGFVARADFVPQAGRRLAGLVDAGARASGAPMLVLEMRGGAMTVGEARFEGFERADVDLLFVAADDALAELVRAGAPNVLAVVKRALRTGSVVFYALKPKHELQDSGYEDFLDSLGLAFLGACR
jgi:hypothetical protein